ncbi:hypothetical protein [Microbacterium sp. NPDC090003]|uniref:hypothetical protein n=1 Tax=Microbacterium sp. NPDC090003 TaxID=3364203 RepID=UPI0037FACB56
MNALTVLSSFLSVFAGISGAIILLFRGRVLKLVRARYEAVFRKDELSEAEIARRLPRMWLVVFIGVGLLVVAAFAATAVWASVTQCAGIECLSR